MSTADPVPPPDAAPSAKLCAMPQQATMTEMLHDYPPFQNDDPLYPTHPNTLDSNRASIAPDQSYLNVSALYQTDNVYGYAWDHNLLNGQVQLPYDIPGAYESEENGVQHQASWNQIGRTSLTTNGGGAITTARPVSQYVPVEPMSGTSGFEQLQRPSPPCLDQIPLSRSQSQSSNGQAADPQTPKRNQASTQPLPPPTRGSGGRESATKHRAKAKRAEAELESREKALSLEHQQLTTTARDLRDEVLLLKNEVLSHGNCGHALIEQYLSNQAQLSAMALNSNRGAACAAAAYFR